MDIFQKIFLLSQISAEQDCSDQLSARWLPNLPDMIIALRAASDIDQASKCLRFNESSLRPCPMLIYCWKLIYTTSCTCAVNNRMSKPYGKSRKLGFWEMRIDQEVSGLPCSTISFHLPVDLPCFWIHQQMEWNNPGNPKICNISIKGKLWIISENISHDNHPPQFNTPPRPG